MGTLSYILLQYLMEPPSVQLLGTGYEEDKWGRFR